jgi:hypothetical protein
MRSSAASASAAETTRTRRFPPVRTHVSSAALLGLQAGGVGQDQRAALAFDDRLHCGQRLDLFRRDPRGELAGYQVARLSPDENVRHSDALKTGKG